MKNYTDFSLNNSENKKITISNLLEEGSVWLMFYRGHW